ncbi:MAG: hypothetical protein SPJ69_02235 [Campylobacter sp.]|uniref:hypothetical protein n=1 Tax=Campylobacter sp. TaxID=205 RepID=UPI0029747036|nr:hypothetical protein [Campylobacter sp.]MDD7600387.1 hypothetical protein [Campylobacteraceae bacterium]MDY5887120.1 hypothetical protein [Campylobacter sp.]
MQSKKILEPSFLLPLLRSPKRPKLGILEFPSLLTAATAKFKGQYKSRIPKTKSRIP